MKIFGRLAGLVAALVAVAWAPGARGSGLVPQVPLPGNTIPKYVTPLPTFGPGGVVPRVHENNLVVQMVQTTQQVLPSGFPQTMVWAYQIKNPLGQPLAPPHWPAVTVEAWRGMPTTMRYENDLPGSDVDDVELAINDPEFSLQTLITVDQTLHWADPLKRDCAMFPAQPICGQPYLGPVPAVVHLHGGEVPSAYDGNANSWFTPTFAQTGPGFVTDTYVYPNAQEPGTLWFHDHALGATRTNVYSGLAAFYLLRDPMSEPKNLPTGKYEVEMAIQDRQFDTSGQLLFPDQGINPEHPFWIPEFFGDTIVVNGATWPFMNVEPRRYHFRILNGSNARFYNLSFGSAPVWRIGADDNFMDHPVPVTNLFLVPGERADLIIDFAPVAGQTFVVSNDAAAPFPSGDVPSADTTAQIMQFRVGAMAMGPDTSCNPSHTKNPIGYRPGLFRPGGNMMNTYGDCSRPKPIVRLTNQGMIAQGVKVDKVRRLTLNEITGAGGPLEVLLNNSNFDAPNTENPRVGSTELWEVINLTADTHPIHTHLVQYQILNRQDFDVTSYNAVYESSFPGGIFQPGGGPPLPYYLGSTWLQGHQVPLVGGNPDVTPFLVGAATPPAPDEAQWKDIAPFPTGQVTRILVRWAPTDAPTMGYACPATNPVPRWAKPCKPVSGSNLFPFDPTLGITEPMSLDFNGNPGGPGYLWHCHIIDHEDNDMMRPYLVKN